MGSDWNKSYVVILGFKNAMSRKDEYIAVARKHGP